MAFRGTFAVIQKSKSYSVFVLLKRHVSLGKSGRKKLWNQRYLNRMIPSFSLQATPLAVRLMALLGKKWAWSLGRV